MICDLCPRRCGALRTEERGLGRCRMPELPVLVLQALLCLLLPLPDGYVRVEPDYHQFLLLPLRMFFHLP